MVICLRQAHLNKGLGRHGTFIWEVGLTQKCLCCSHMLSLLYSTFWQGFVLSFYLWSSRPFLGYFGVYAGVGLDDCMATRWLLRPLMAQEAIVFHAIWTRMYAFQAIMQVSSHRLLSSIASRRTR